MLFGSLRGPMLEFLRNLTPQILLLSIATILGLKLDLNKFDIGNFWGTLPFLLILATFFVALVANIITLIEKTIDSIAWVDEEGVRLQSQGIKGCKRLKVIFQMLCKQNKVFFVEISLVFLIALAGYVVVITTSISTAMSIYNTLHFK